MRHAVGVQDQKALFSERLKRINSGKQFEHADVVGHNTQMRYNKIAARRPKSPRTFGQKLMILIAFLSGILAVLIGRITYYHLSRIEGLPDAFYDLESRGMFLFALITAGILTISFHLSTKGRMQALALGCVLMHFGESAAAATLPDLWAEMFSPEYAAAKISEAQSSLGDAAL
jgi:hypothetical protein